MAVFEREAIDITTELADCPFLSKHGHPGSSSICFWCIGGLPVDPSLADRVGDGSQSFSRGGTVYWGCGRHPQDVFNKLVRVYQAMSWDKYVKMTITTANSGEGDGGEQNAAVDERTENDDSLAALGASDIGKAKDAEQQASNDQEIDDEESASAADSGQAKSKELPVHVDEDTSDEDLISAADSDKGEDTEQHATRLPPKNPPSLAAAVDATPTTRKTPLVRECIRRMRNNTNAHLGNCYLCYMGFKPMPKRKREILPAPEKAAWDCGRHKKKDYKKMMIQTERRIVRTRLNDFADALDHQLSTESYKQTSDGKHVFKSTLRNMEKASSTTPNANADFQETEPLVSNAPSNLARPKLGTWLFWSFDHYHDKVTKQLSQASKALSNARSDLKDVRYDETTGILMKKSLKKAWEMCRELEKEVMAGQKKAKKEEGTVALEEAKKEEKEC